MRHCFLSKYSCLTSYLRGIVVALPITGLLYRQPESLRRRLDDIASTASHHQNLSSRLVLELVLQVRSSYTGTVLVIVIRSCWE